MQFDDRGILLRYEYCYSPHRYFLFYCVCDFTPACDFDLELLEEEKVLSKSKISGGIIYYANEDISRSCNYKYSIFRRWSGLSDIWNLESGHGG